MEIILMMLSWFFIGYVSILIVFKITKTDISDIDNDNLFILGVSLGLITPILAIIFGILYLAIVIPYKLLFPEDKQ